MIKINDIIGIVISTNCPVLKAMGSSGLNFMVFIVGVSIITSRTSALIGLYGLELCIVYKFS